MMRSPPGVKEAAYRWHHEPRSGLRIPPFRIHVKVQQEEAERLCDGDQRREQPDHGLIRLCPQKANVAREWHFKRQTPTRTFRKDESATTALTTALTTGERISGGRKARRRHSIGTVWCGRNWKWKRVGMEKVGLEEVGMEEGGLEEVGYGRCWCVICV